MALIDSILKRFGYQKAEPIKKDSYVLDITYRDPTLAYKRPEGISDYLEVYRTHPWINACIDKVAEAVASVPFKLFTQDQEGKVQEVTSGELYDLFQSVNDYTTVHDFWEQMVIDLEVTGNFFAEIEFAGSKPVALHHMQPDCVRIIPDPKKRVKEFWYTVNGHTIILPAENVLHLYYYDPLSPLWGLSPLTSISLTLTADFYARAYNRRFFENDASVPAVLETDQKLTPEDIDRVKKSWASAHQGVDKAHKIAVTWGGLKYRETGLAPKDAQFLELIKMHREEICAALGVPPAVVGIFEYANYANCLPGYTRITLPSGLAKPLSEINEGDQVIAFDFETKTFKPTKVLKKWHTGKKKILEIKTGSRKIHASEGHKFLRLAPGTNPAYPRKEEWIEAKDLKSGDFIAIQVDGVQGARTTLPDGTEATPDLMEQLGLFLGDGNIRRRHGYAMGVSFAIPINDERREYYEEQAQRVWITKRNFKDKRPVHITKSKYTFTVNSRAACELIISNGFDREDRAAKTIPDWIFELTPELKAAFLYGLIAADGSVGPCGRITIAMKDKETVKRLRELCISIGWNVCNISSGSKESNYGPNEAHRFVISWSGNGNKEFEHHKLGDQLAWSRIREINEVGEDDVYDIEVDGYHNFVAEGILTHNSEAQIKMFWYDKILPLLTKVEQMITEHFISRFDEKIFGQFDISGIEALREDETKVADIDFKLVSSGLATINERRALKGQEAVPWGDTGYIPMSWVPAGESGEAEEPTVKISRDMPHPLRLGYKEFQKYGSRP